MLTFLLKKVRNVLTWCCIVYLCHAVLFSVICFYHSRFVADMMYISIQQNHLLVLMKTCEFKRCVFANVLFVVCKQCCGWRCWQLCRVGNCALLIVWMFHTKFQSVFALLLFALYTVCAVISSCCVLLVLIISSRVCHSLMGVIFVFTNLLTRMINCCG